MAACPGLLKKLACDRPLCADVASFGTARAVQGVVLAIALVGPLAFFYYMALPVSLLAALLDCASLLIKHALLQHCQFDCA